MCDYCQWIDNVAYEAVKNLSSKNRNPFIKKQITARKPSPIVVIHGFPNDVKDPNPSIPELMKKSAAEGYKMLIQGRQAVDVVESTISLLDEGNETSRGALVKSSALVDDQGRTGCVIGTNDSSAIFEARRLMEGSAYPLVVQEKSIEKNERKNSFKDSREGMSGCWGVIARDRSGRISCGRISWEFREDFPPSIPAAGTIYGCGIFMGKNTCFSVSGDDEVIYTRVPARRMSREMKNTDKHLTSRRQIAKLMSEFEGERVGVVFLGSFDRAVIFCESEAFPWVYCSRNMMSYGGSAGEIHSEDVPDEGKSHCTCHWR